MEEPPKKNKNEDDVGKRMGPTEEKIKKTFNKKINKKQRSKKMKEEKKIQKRIRENEEKVFDFVDDFSSSDYSVYSKSEEEEASDSRSVSLENLTNSFRSQLTAKMEPTVKNRFEPLIKNYRRFDQRKRKKPEQFYQKKDNHKKLYLT